MEVKAMRDWASMKFGRVISEEELQHRTSPVWPYKYFNPGKPVDPAQVDAILRGVVDIHVHGAPLGSWLAGRPSMVQTSIEASAAGVQALVFKDHNTMTNNCALIIQELLDQLCAEKNKQGAALTPVQVYGGIVLNETVGGMNARAVETALGYGRCKEVWLPSLDARHQRQAMGLQGGIAVADGGDVTPETKKILELLHGFNSNRQGDRCALSTCHVSNEEKFTILHFVKQRGLDVDVLLDHVTQELTVTTPDEAKQLIDLGGYLEFAQCSSVPWPGMNDWIVAFDYSFNLIRELLKDKGPDHLVLITDAGQPGNKPIDGWRNFIRVLLAQGVSEQHINVMAKDVPRRLLRI